MNLQIIQDRIYEIRNVKVMLDFDLAEMYQVVSGNACTNRRFTKTCTTNLNFVNL